MSKKTCHSCSTTFSSNTSDLCLKCMMNGVIANQEAAKSHTKSIKPVKPKKATYAKLMQEEPDRDKQWEDALRCLRKIEPKNKPDSLAFGLKPKIKTETVRLLRDPQKPRTAKAKIEVKKIVKGPRIVRPPPQKKLTGTFCILCGATVIDIRQHKHDVHHERLYVSSAPTRSAKENVWVSIYEGGAPGLGKRHS